MLPAADLPGGAAAALLHARPIQGKAQHVQDGVGRVGEGIDPPAVFLHGQKPQLMEKGQGRFHPKGFQRRAHEIRLRTVIVCRGGGGVGQVAAAVASGQKLAPQALLPLQQHNPVPLLRGAQRGHHAGGAAADHDDRFHCFGSGSFRCSLCFFPSGVWM